MENKISQSLIIKTNKPQSRYVELTGMDLLFGPMRATSIYLFRESLDIERLLASLQTVIDAFPEAAGRLAWINDRLVILLANQGVLVEIVDSEKNSPDFETDFSPTTSAELIIEYPRTGEFDLSSEPLLTFRITRFRDGISSMGMNYCHALGDGSAIFAFMYAWSKSYGGEAFTPPNGGRQLVREVTREEPLPSEKAGFSMKPFPAQVISRPPLLGELFSVPLKKGEYEKIQTFTKGHALGISANDYLHAMVFKTFSESAGYAADDMVTASLPYDARRVKNSPIPMGYFGNATLFRALRLPFHELSKLTVLEISKLFRNLSEPDIDSLRKDIGFLQSQYEQGKYNKFGTYTEFLTPNIAGGIYINNVINLSSAILTFNNDLLWRGAGITAKRPFGIRLAVLISDLSGDIAVRLSLGRDQVEKFKTHWRQCVDQAMTEIG